MKVAKTGIISKKTASRKISRITKKIQSQKNKLVNLKLINLLIQVFDETK